MEQWKPVSGYERRYEVSDLGRVRAIKTGKIMKFGKSKGYHNISFWEDGCVVKTTYTIHRLVALHFIGPSLGPQIRHLDGDMLNNTVANLAWGSAKDNAADRKAHGTWTHGEKHFRANLTAEKVLHIRSLARSGLGPTAIGKLLGMHRARVHEVVRRTTWKHI